MISRIALPEVGLITSWHVPVQSPKVVLGLLPALEVALQEDVNVLDLYFLNHVDIPWYAAAAGCTRNRPKEPHAFAASLKRRGIERIADRLREGLTTQSGARAIGKLSRFAALATFFPNASRRGRRVRWQAVKALRNCFYLGSCLGCFCVEMVGGAGVPRPKSRFRGKPEDYRALRLQSLAQTLVDVFDTADPENPLRVIPQDKVPLASIELEPGRAFLLNAPSVFRDLRAKVRELCQAKPGSLASRSLSLNVDIAHAFLIPYTPRTLRELEVDGDVAHVHISDHGDKLQGAVHTCDLVPGTVHGYDEYLPWLKFAIERTRHRKRFSGVVSVELEAINDVDEALRAIAITRRWLREAAANSK